VASASLGIVLIAKRFRSNGILANELVTLLHPHQDAVQRPAEVPGLGVDSAGRSPTSVPPHTLPVALIIECGLPRAAVGLLYRGCLFVDGGDRGYVTGYDAWNALMRHGEFFPLPIEAPLRRVAPVHFLLEIRNAVRTWEGPYASHD